LQANQRAVANARHRLRLGKYFRVGSNADFEILRPRALFDQHALYPCRFLRARANRGEVIAKNILNTLADRFGFVRVAPRLFFDDPFEHAGDESYTGGLDGLQITGREQPGSRGVWLRMAIREQRFDFTDRRPLRGVHRGGDVDALEPGAHRRYNVGEIDDGSVGSDRNWGRPTGRARNPSAA